MGVGVAAYVHPILREDAERRGFDAVGVRSTGLGPGGAAGATAEQNAGVRERDGGTVSEQGQEGQFVAPSSRTGHGGRQWRRNRPGKRGGRAAQIPGARGHRTWRAIVACTHHSVAKLLLPACAMRASDVRSTLP